MTEKRITEQEWYEWTNTVYKSQYGRLFIQQLFRICRFWSSEKTLLGAGFTAQEIIAYNAICKIILNGLNSANIADLFDNTRKSDKN